MLFNNILRILKSYRFSLIKIIFFELIYLIKGYKGNNITFSKNNLMTNNIPCPYYFLHKIEKILKSLENIACIESYYINDKKGYSIYYGKR